MQNQNLPDYKNTFLRQMDQLRNNQSRKQQTCYQTNQQQDRKLAENNIVNTSQYSTPLWKEHLHNTYYQRQHNQVQNVNALSLSMNPQIARKTNNITTTKISEYSNAKHNNTVFVNPKNTSC